MKELAARFIPAADEVWYLQHSKGPEGALFRAFSEKGHYGGRTTPTDTRQGIYMAAPSGAFLASLNHNDPRRVEEALRRALVAWDALPEEERLGPALPGEEERPRLRPEDRLPAKALVLAETTRDLPREGEDAGRRDWRALAWNRDTAWFTAEEAAAMVPAGEEPGAAAEWPAPLASRFARCHLADIVRGQSPAFRGDAVKEARVVSTVTAVEGPRVTLRLEGSFDLIEKGRWVVEGDREGREPRDREHSFRGSLLGTAVFDRAAGRFTTFEAVVAGLRAGATRYNGRADDPGPAPQGFVFALEAPGAPVVAPANLSSYGW